MEDEMTITELLFLVVAAVTLFSAVMVVSLRKLFHSALWLVMALLGVASLFAMLEASFFAAVQLLVYIGAIAILLIFAVMLTRNIMTDDDIQHNRSWGISLVLVAIIFVLLVTQMSTWSGFNISLIGLEMQGQENIILFGKALLDPTGFALPFESASILLLAALIGGVYIALDRKGDQP
jgi:NADH-quinone oxidoreductase subunit J